MEKRLSKKGLWAKGMIRKGTLVLLSLCIFALTAYATVPVQAAKSQKSVLFSKLNADNVFLKQTQPHVCTLTSTAMMVRRAAMLNGNEEWEKITEATVRQMAWAEGAGLKWNFTSHSISVTHKSLSGTKELISMLDKHPEGIVIYNPGRPHAILVTDYTDGVFYCSDPSNGSPKGRYPISQASITAESASRCWYVTTATTLPVLRDDITYEVDNLKYQLESESTVACVGVVKKKSNITIPDKVMIDGSEYVVSKIDSSAFAKNSSLKNLTIGENITKIQKQAFYKCKKLASVEITTQNLKTVGKKAFYAISNDAQIIVNDEAQRKLVESSSLSGEVHIVVSKIMEREVVSYNSKNNQ